MQPVRAVAVQFTRHAGGGRLVMRLEKLGIHLERRAHAERRQHEVAGGETLVGAEVAGALIRRLLETLDRALGALARAAAPEMPAAAAPLLRRWAGERVALLRTMRDAASE